MFCENCGTKIEDENAKFCINCGAKINREHCLKEKQLETMNSNKTSLEDLGCSLMDLYNKNYCKKLLMQNIYFTEEEILEFVKKENDKKILLKQNESRAVKSVLNAFKKAEKDLQKEENKLKKEDLEMCTKLRITKDEFDSLTVMEKAELRMKFKNSKNTDNLTGMVAMGSIANGFDRLF